MFPNEFKKLVLSMGELNRQRPWWRGVAGFGPEGKNRGHPLASVGLPPDGEEPVRQVARDGIAKHPVRKPLSLSLPD